MSTMVVTPPAAAARVAVSKPSHSVRPGSFTCTWVSTTPGSSAASPTSSCRAASGGPPCSWTAVITPSAIDTAAGRMPSPVTTRVLRMTRSGAAIKSLRPDPSTRVLPQRPPHQDGNVVRASGVEGVPQQVLADLFRRRHCEEALAEAIAGNVLREAVAAQQADVAPLLLHVSDDRCRLRSPQGARQHVGERRVQRVAAPDHAPIDEVLRERLVARELHQLAVPEQVAAAVAHLEQIRARPHANPQCQRRRHVRLQRTRRTVSLNVLVDPQRGGFERPGEALFVHRVLRVIAVYRLGDVPRDRADRQPTRFLASGSATDTIGDHGEERQALGVLRQELRRGEAREMHLNLFVERGDEEVRSEEHTSELQSRLHLVCRLLLEKKKKKEIEILQDTCRYMNTCSIANKSM